MVAMALVFMAAPAAAQEGDAPDWANKSGAVGVGATTTLGGTSGINVRTYVTPQLGLELALGFALSKDEQGDFSFDQTEFQVGLYGSYKVAYWQRGSLSAIFGADIDSVSQTSGSGDSESDDSATDLLIGLGLQGEYFPTQYLSLFAQAGLSIDFIGEDEVTEGSIDSAPDRSGFALDLGTDLFGSAGFTVWFK
ncbi:MAG: hypothetical protein HYY06_04055 [Deltaproteobacteria bacterium]|nr:hypothetical protein [Deltaproteobacteria bacterium]